VRLGLRSMLGKTTMRSVFGIVLMVRRMRFGAVLVKRMMFDD
jgi:hypothetical protein